MGDSPDKRQYTVAEMHAAVAEELAVADINPIVEWDTRGIATLAVKVEMLAKMLDQLGVRRLNMLAEHARNLERGARMSVDNDDRDFIVVKLGSPFHKDGARMTPVFLVALDAFEQEAFP